MEILTGLFIVGLYKATEKIWEKGFDAAWTLEVLGRAEEAAEVLLALARDKEMNNWVHNEAYQSLKALVGVATD